mmetsp:Transcript_40145/g.119630  ORF Transcript_40145/g.119630 Transcript_40145/m.119630 type:complete len:384 (-) Transcript_40145:499-1650(-)
MRVRLRLHLRLRLRRRRHELLHRRVHVGAHDAAAEAAHVAAAAAAARLRRLGRRGAQARTGQQVCRQVMLQRLQRRAGRAANAAHAGIAAHRLLLAVREVLQCRVGRGRNRRRRAALPALQAQLLQAGHAAWRAPRLVARMEAACRRHLHDRVQPRRRPHALPLAVLAERAQAAVVGIGVLSAHARVHQARANDVGAVVKRAPRRCARHRRALEHAPRGRRARRGQQPAGAHAAHHAAGLFLWCRTVNRNLVAVEPVLAGHDLFHRVGHRVRDKADSAVALLGVVLRHVGVLQLAKALKVGTELRLRDRRRDARHKDARRAWGRQVALWQRDLGLAPPTIDHVLGAKGAHRRIRLDKAHKPKAARLARVSVFHDLGVLQRAKL